MHSNSRRCFFNLYLSMTGLLVSFIWLAGCISATPPSAYSRIDPGGDYVYVEPAWSPDSLRIAYTRYERLSPFGTRDTTGEIFSMNFSGDQIVQLTHNSLRDFNPAWSPDGKQLVYVREYVVYDDQSNQRMMTDTLRIMNADGSGDKEIYTCTIQCGSPSWSPDGKRIAFYALSEKRSIGSTSEPPSDIYLIAIEGSELTQVTHQSNQALWPRWSQDNRRIAYVDNLNNQIRVVDTQSNTEVAYALGNLRSASFHPAWSPNGTGIIFSAIVPVTGSWQQCYLSLTTAKIDLFFASGEQVPSLATQLDWSADGSKLAFIVADSQIYNADLSILKHR